MSFDIRISKRLGTCAINCMMRSDDQLVALVGPSGKGKTSVLKCIAGLVRPADGHIQIGGRTLFDSATNVDQPANERGCGYVFQENRLFPHLTVEKNLLYGKARQDSSLAYGLLDIAELLDIVPLLKRRPAMLSGGEQRRVAIGRALMSGPAFLLLDEPLASLDAGRGDTILKTLDRLRADTDIPMLYVTHSDTELGRLACPVFTLD